jgi:hypothetical protein
MRQDAKRENILYGSSIDEQRRRAGKDPQTCGLSSGGGAGRVAPQSQSTLVMRLARRPPELSALITYLGDWFERGSTPLPASGLEPAPQVCSAC